MRRFIKYFTFIIILQACNNQNNYKKYEGKKVKDLLSNEEIILSSGVIIHEPPFKVQGFVVQTVEDSVLHVVLDNPTTKNANKVLDLREEKIFKIYYLDEY